MSEKTRYLTSIELEIDGSSGHVSFDNREAAQAWCDNWNSQLSEEEKKEGDGRFFATVFEINV